jgi:uncharacterized integral membrane protein
MLRLIVNIVLLIILVVFIALNVVYRTTINLFGMVLEDVSVVAVVLMAIVFGIVYSFITYVIMFFLRKKRERLRKNRDQTKQKERELKERERDVELIESEMEPKTSDVALAQPKDQSRQRKKSKR